MSSPLTPTRNAKIKKSESSHEKTSSSLGAEAQDTSPLKTAHTAIKVQIKANLSPFPHTGTQKHSPSKPGSTQATPPFPPFPPFPSFTPFPPQHPQQQESLQQPHPHHQPHYYNHITIHPSEIYFRKLTFSDLSLLPNLPSFLKKHKQISSQKIHIHCDFNAFLVSSNTLCLGAFSYSHLNDAEYLLAAVLVRFHYDFAVSANVSACACLTDSGKRKEGRACFGKAWNSLVHWARNRCVCNIVHFALLDEVRSIGVGERLLKELESVVKEEENRKVIAISAFVQENNTNSIQFFFQNKFTWLKSKKNHFYQKQKGKNVNSCEYQEVMEKVEREECDAVFFVKYFNQNDNITLVNTNQNILKDGLKEKEREKEQLKKESNRHSRNNSLCKAICKNSKEDKIESSTLAFLKKVLGCLWSRKAVEVKNACKMKEIIIIKEINKLGKKNRKLKNKLKIYGALDKNFEE
jgi:ribosomal protein S18 acetylase RimI-like enzyme